MQAESADMALHESNRQIHSHRTELYEASQIKENSQREQVWLQAELENRERALRESRFENYPGNGRIEKIASVYSESAHGSNSGITR